MITAPGIIHEHKLKTRVDIQDESVSYSAFVFFQRILEQLGHGDMILNKDQNYIVKFSSDRLKTFNLFVHLFKFKITNLQTDDSDRLVCVLTVNQQIYIDEAFLNDD